LGRSTFWARGDLISNAIAFRKEFIIGTEYQLLEARLIGADVILVNCSHTIDRAEDNKHLLQNLQNNYILDVLLGVPNSKRNHLHKSIMTQLAYVGVIILEYLNHLRCASDTSKNLSKLNS